jgi:hypothetical protein
MSEDDAFCLNPFFVDYIEDRICVICRGVPIYYITRTRGKGRYSTRYAHVCSEECFNMWLIGSAGSMPRLDVLDGWSSRFDRDKKDYR